MKRLLVALTAAAAAAVLALPGAAGTRPSATGWSAGGSAPGTAKIGIQSTTIGTDVNPIDGWNQGWWSSDHINFNGNTNYLAGHSNTVFGAADPGTTRNYFTFDISALSAHPCATPQSATLTVDAAVGSFAFFGVGPTAVTYRLYGVDTDPFVLSQKSNNPNAAIFNDLGSGPLFGSYFLPTTTFGGTFNLNLNATALNAIAAAKANGQQYFSIGGSLVPQPVAGEVFLYGASGGVPGQLTVNWPFLCRIRPPA